MERLHVLMSDPNANPEALSKAVSLVEAAVEAACYIMEVKLFLKLNFHICLIPLTKALSQVSASAAASPSKDQTGLDVDGLVGDSDNDSSDSETSFYSEADLGAWRAGGGPENFTEDDEDMVNVHSLTCHPVG